MSGKVGDARHGAMEDIILQALADYDGYMLDDDYDAQGALDRIIRKMRERLSLYRPDEHTAALSASPQDGWKTIDSAPKDGTGILAYVDGFGMGQFVLFWLDGYWREGASLMGLKTQPTHWQPLPAPPALPQPTGDGT